ncbi:MAG: nucleotidyltransferase domain-containing protein [Candidatus Solibacter sp.]
MPEQLTKQETIQEITRRLVEYYHPERVYIFGSAARGDDGPDSDLDFCVVLPDDAPGSFYRPGAREAIRGIGTAVDVVRWAVTDFDARATHVLASLPATVVREGRLLYDARSIAA